MKISTKYKCDKCGKEFEIPANQNKEEYNNGSLCEDCYKKYKQRIPQFSFGQCLTTLNLAREYCYSEGRIHLAENIIKVIQFIKYHNKY